MRVRRLGLVLIGIILLVIIGIFIGVPVWIWPLLGAVGIVVVVWVVDLDHQDGS